MTQSLPYGGFKWSSEWDLSTVRRLMDIKEDSCDGYILEVDLEYPQELHDTHKDLPFCPEHKVPPGSKQEKLLTTLYKKERYVIHYRALQQAIQNGLKLTKIHRAIEFKQKPWLKEYVDMNTQERMKATNYFDKNMYKLMINAVYGKTMENERKRVDVKHVSRWDKTFGTEAYISQPNFHSCAIINENLVVIQMNRTKIPIKKPIYVGLSVLDLSKIKLYDFHYGYIIPNVGDKAKLLYTDNDSLIYEFKNFNIYN